MNQHGFRGPEISERPGPGVTRVVVLGASETFGLYESRDMEFPAVLRRLLETEGKFEVINAALPGMTVRSMKPYWDAWVRRFAPHVVIIYPSPLFYLNMGGPARASSAKEPVQQARGADCSLQPRIMERIKDVFEYPLFIQRRRDARRLEELLQAQDPASLLTDVPSQLVTAFKEDVGHLVSAVRATGATCMLVIHAMRVSMPPREEDRALLESARVHVPRATASVIAGFEDAADRTIRECAGEAGVLLSDAAGELGGKEECFADLVHFTDRGAEAMARLLARDLLEALRTKQH
jgi:lysophospholipase L1-like esterase